MAGKRKTPVKQVEYKPDYRQFFKTSKDVMFITSKKGEWIDFNDAALDLFGFSTREELAAVKITSLYAKASDRKNHTGHIDKQGFVKDFPVQLSRKDGSAFSALISTTAIQDQEGNVTSYMGTIREVTGEPNAGENLQKKNEDLNAVNEALTIKEAELRALVESLSESERKFHSLFDAMKEGVALHKIIYDKNQNARDYQIIEVNPAFETNTGIPADRIRGKIASKVYGTGEAPYLDIYAKVALSGLPGSFEIFFPPLKRHFHISVFSPKKDWFATVFTDISERKHLEEERALVHRELEEQHTLFSAIINSAVSNIFSVDTEYRYTSFNQQHAATMNALFGEEIEPGKSILDYITIEKDKRAMKTNLDRALSGETVLDEGYTGDHSLSRQYMEPSFNPIRNPDGDVIGVAVISRDATERKKAEKALRASEERYRRLTENSRDIIFRLSLPERHFEYVSPAVTDLTGFPPESFYQNANQMQDLIHPDFQVSFKKQWERMPKGDIPREYEYQILQKTGESRWFHQRNTLVRDNTGHIVALEGIVTDITDRKKAEIALLKTEELYRLISENTGDVIWILNIKTEKFAFMSPSIYRLLGYTVEESMALTMPQILTPESLARVRDAIPPTIAAIQSGDDTLRIQTHYVENVRKDGSIVPVEIVATILSEGETGRFEILGITRDISERMKAQDALKESEEKFRSLVETISDLVWEVDTQAIYTYVSPKVRDMMGYEPEEMVGKTPFEFMPPDEAERIADLFDQCLEKRQTATAIVNRCLHKDGSVVVMETSAVPRFANDGSFAGYRGIDRDITQRKIAQDALEESEERYRTFVESANEAIFVIQDGKIPFCNKKGLDLIGYDSGYLASHTFLDLLHPDDRIAALERHNRRIRGEMIDPLAELRVIDGSGTLHWLEINAVIVPWDGKPATLNFAADITTRKKGDDALRESEHHYHLLADNVQDVIWTADKDMRLTYVSPSVKTIMGYLPEEFLLLSPLECLTPESLQTLMASRQECLTNIASGHPDALKPQMLELEYLCKDKTKIWAEVVISLIHSEKGEPLGVIGVTRDITDRKLAEVALQNSEDYLMTIINLVQTGLVIIDPQTLRIVDVNPSAAAMIGGKREDIIGSACHQFICTENDRGCPAANPDCTIDNTECTLMSVNGPKPILKTVIPMEISGTRYLLESFIDITDSKEAEKALIESESKFRELIEHSTDIIYTIDFSGILTSISPGVSRIMGYHPDELIGKNISDYLSPESLVTAMSEINMKRAHTATSSLYEVQLRAKDGQYVPFEINSRIRMREGRPHDILGIARDISQRKKVEAALRNSEIYLKTIISSVQTGLVIIDPETHKIVDINPAAEKMVGVKREKILGSVCHNFICPSEVGNCPVTDLGHTVDNSERTMVTSDGSISILKTVIPVVLGGKQYLLESFIDITDRKRAEEALIESEGKFHLIFKNSNDAIYLFEITPSGMPGRIVDANEVALQHTGQSKANLLIRTFLEIHSHDLPQKSRAIMMELLTKGQVRFETDVVRPDSTKMPVEVSAQFAKLNQKTYVIAISRDISRRKREERALRITNQKLQLMNIVAWHDIQNKVTGLRGYVELSKDLVTDETMKKFIQSEEEVLKVIHQQLQYTKEYQEMGVHPQEWVNLSQTLRMILSLAELGSIQIVIDISDLEVFCDPVIAKVFSHLIDNTKTHGKKATSIHISCRESVDGLHLIYEDDGIGISEEQKKELFMRNVGTTTGFSLFFIHDLLEVSEMTIRETGTYGEGVRFEIGIPRGIYRFGHKSP